MAAFEASQVTFDRLDELGALYAVELPARIGYVGHVRVELERHQGAAAEAWIAGSLSDLATKWSYGVVVGRLFRMLELPVRA